MERCSLERGGDVGQTAAALGVHRNTVRDRVSSFEAVTGLDLSDATARLVIQLQLTAAPAPPEHRGAEPVE